MTTATLEPGDFITPTVRLVRPLAEGGMGRVWVAEHLGLHTQVVVKLMAHEMAERPDGAERFAREAAACAAIKSPHVVQVFDHGRTADGVPYIVMELLEGKDLAAHLAAHGRMDPADVLALVVQVGRALSKAHKAGIIHRDIKPENIFLCDAEDGQILVKLLDFGTAKCDGFSSTRTTVPGQIMGTPHYMSPEQTIGSELDERSDIWSLGVVVFESLTGKKPFDGPSLGAITMAIHGPLPSLVEHVTGLPPALDEWFARACAQRPEDRFGSVREATDAFAVALTGAAPVEQPTESVFLSVRTVVDASQKGASSPVPPLTRPVQPLMATLPERGSERRPTVIAFGLVVGAAAIAMGAILFGRTEPQEPPADQRPAQAAEAPTAEPAPPPASAPPATDDAKQKAAKAPTAARPAAPHAAGNARRAAAPASPKPPSRTAHEAQPKASKTTRGATPPAPSAGNEDDDLERLRKASAKHAEPAAPPPAPPAPPASLPPASEGKAPAPAPKAEPEGNNAVPAPKAEGNDVAPPPLPAAQ
jgi:serine/threonine-protein kinase